ncbi:MAG: helix-turn-helix transcriptional regulator, partial [Chthoniobacteraceae bacterium]
MPQIAPLSLKSPEPERGAWASVGNGWQHVYGSFERLGVSIEKHEFQVETSLDWGRSFHGQSVELCLNLEGKGTLGAGRSATHLRAATAASYFVSDEEPLAATRLGGERHHFVTLEFSPEYLARSVAGCEDALEPHLRESLDKGSTVAPLRLMTPSQHALAVSICEPPVPAAALPLWYESKVLECIASFLFQPKDELFCSRQKRVAQDRVARVVSALKEGLEEPPSLDELGRIVGVSPYYLSRIFSQEMKMTIPQYIRRIRMEKAAELLRDGKHNVT